MTEPRPLTDAELLAWPVVMAYRGQQRRDGITILLLPFPPCPVCGGDVHSQNNVTTERGIRRKSVVTLHPCGHEHVAKDDQFDGIFQHYSAMMKDLDGDWRGKRAPGGWLPERWTTADVVREARRRVGDQSGPVVDHAATAIDVQPTVDGTPEPDRQPAYDAVYAYLTATTDVPRDLVTRNAIAWRAVHAALDAVLGTQTTPDNPTASSDTADNSTAEAALERLRTENAAAQSLIRMQDEAIQRVRNLANRIALDSPWARETAHQFRLAVQPPTPDGPTVAELAANDRNWDVEKGGE